MSEDLLKVKTLLRARGCTDRTIINYISCLNRFKNYFKEKDISKLSEDDILEYLKINFIDLGYAPASINVNRAAIIYYYLVNFNKEFNSFLLPYCKNRSKIPYILDKQDFSFLINNTNNIKHKIWLCLGYGSGLRVSEIISLKLGDFSYNLRKIKVTGKGGKERFVPFPEFTHNLLLEYYKENKDNIIKAGGYLFPSSKPSCKTPYISSYTIKEAFSSLKKRLNISTPITFHTLRHSFATEFIGNGGDLWKLKAILGHASINSTTIYLHIAENFNDIHSPLDII